MSNEKTGVQITYKEIEHIQKQASIPCIYHLLNSFFFTQNRDKPSFTSALAAMELPPWH